MQHLFQTAYKQIAIKQLDNSVLTSRTHLPVVVEIGKLGFKIWLKSNDGVFSDWTYRALFIFTNTGDQPKIFYKSPNNSYLLHQVMRRFYNIQKEYGFKPFQITC